MMGPALREFFFFSFASSRLNIYIGCSRMSKITSLLLFPTWRSSWICSLPNFKLYTKCKEVLPCEVRRRKYDTLNDDYIYTLLVSADLQMN